MQLLALMLSLTMSVVVPRCAGVAITQIGWIWQYQAVRETPQDEPARGAEGTKSPPDSDSSSSADMPPKGNDAPSPPTIKPVTEERVDGKLSDAERITRLQRSVETDQATITSLRASLEDPASDFREAEGTFKQLDEELERVRQSSKEAKSNETTEVPVLLSEAERETLQTRWQLAKERFDVAIEQRKMIQEKIATLEEKILQDQQALHKLLGIEEPERAPVPLPNKAIVETNLAVPLDSSLVAPPIAAVPVVPAPVTPLVPPSSIASETSGAMTMESLAFGTAGSNPLLVRNALPRGDLVAAPTSPTPGENNTSSAGAAAAPKFLAPAVTAEVQKAAEVAQEKEAEASQAEKEVKSIADRINLLQRNIGIERRLLETSRKKSDLAEDARRVLEAEFRDKLMEGNDRNALTTLQQELHQVQEQLTQARAEAREHATNLDTLQSSLTELMSEQIVLLQEAEGKREVANSAKRRVERLQNPFSPRNALLWCATHGTKIAAILVAMAALLWLSRIAGRRLVTVMSGAEVSDRPDEWENQARTILGVFLNAAKIAILGGGGLMILDATGVPVTALMGGAAVLGLAVAFGAQSLMKDYFYGFMILLEHQYTVNDVVRIGEVAGQVERITLRTTVLRDLEGRVHFIPHGQITSTTNLTQGWSRAVFELNVAYKENVDSIMQVILDLGAQLRDDPEFGTLILDDLNMLGVNALGESGVTLKFFIKTLPLKQWQVKREMLRRIKLRFDELRIEIPFPHRTVYYRSWNELHSIEGGATEPVNIPFEDWNDTKAA